MINICGTIRLGCLLGLLTLTAGPVSAHDYTSLNEFQIDRANDATSENILQIQLFLRDMVQRVHVSSQWPELKLQVMGEALLHQKEEAELGLEYFSSTGINTQSPQAQLENPLIGRTVSAQQAINTTQLLIKYLGTLESQDAFISEVYSGGKSSILYNLMAAQREKMDIYRTLFTVMPSPGQTTAATAPPAPMAVVPVGLYLSGGLGLCALVTMVLRPEKRSA